MPSPPVILCIDDNAAGLTTRRMLLEAKGFRVLLAQDGYAGLAIAGREPIDAVILDYKMPGLDGEAVAKRLRSEHPKIPILLLSGFPQDIPESLLAHVDVFLVRGTPPDVLLKELARLTDTATKPSVDIKNAAEVQRKAVARAIELMQDSAELGRKRGTNER